MPVGVGLVPPAVEPDAGHGSVPGQQLGQLRDEFAGASFHAFTATASSPGLWGNSIRLSVEPVVDIKTDPTGPNAGKFLQETMIAAPTAEPKPAKP